jgi:hypothetical protein
MRKLGGRVGGLLRRARRTLQGLARGPLRHARRIRTDLVIYALAIIGLILAWWVYPEDRYPDMPASLTVTAAESSGPLEHASVIIHPKSSVSVRLTFAEPRPNGQINVLTDDSRVKLVCPDTSYGFKCTLFTTQADNGTTVDGLAFSGTITPFIMTSLQFSIASGAIGYTSTSEEAIVRLPIVYTGPYSSGAVPSPTQIWTKRPDKYDWPDPFQPTNVDGLVAFWNNEASVHARNQRILAGDHAAAASNDQHLFAAGAVLGIAGGMFATAIQESLNRRKNKRLAPRRKLVALAPRIDRPKRLKRPKK